MLGILVCMLTAAPTYAGSKVCTPADCQATAEGTVSKMRREAFKTNREIRNEATEAVNKINKALSKKHGKGHAKGHAKKAEKERAKAVDHICREAEKGIREINELRARTIAQLTDGGCARKYKVRVGNVANRRIAAIMRVRNNNIARINAAASH